MFDFMKIKKTWDGKMQRYVYAPSFVVSSKIKDLMIRSKDFYAIFNEATGLWVQSDAEAIELIDEQVMQYAYQDAGESVNDNEHGPFIKLIRDTDNRLIDVWHRFCQKDMRDNWTPLNQKVIFSNQTPKRSDYVSKVLDYPLVDIPTPNYDKICETLYLPTEVEKWEWFVGCALAGDAKKIQKMLVFYGEPGTGKSTIISKVIADCVFGGEDMFATKFEANNLTNRDNFGTDFLEHDSVLAFDDDAELGVINSKTTLNKIISHESVRVNAKFKSPFVTKPNCLLIIGSNDPVQMSPNSGMNRRLIDVRPTGEKLTGPEYDKCMAGLAFERSGIAYKCLQTYKKLTKHAYDHYIAEDMLSRTSPFHNFVVENYTKLENGISLANAYELYDQYADKCNFKTKLVRFKFRDTLKVYFNSYENQFFNDFKYEKIGMKKLVKEEPEEAIDIPKEEGWLRFNCTTSLMDELFKDEPAQYEQDDPEHPLKYSWDKCKTKLSDIDTSKVHFLKVPIWLIGIDFDKKGPNGEKDLEANIAEANKFPPTYAEVSKSGGGVHLHYIYVGGDPTELSRSYGPNIEVKIFNGGSSLRRKVTLCNDLPLAEIASGLPMKGAAKKMIDYEGLKNERMLRTRIARNLNREYHANTKPSIDFINASFKEAYDKGFSYNLRDMYKDVMDMAKSSHHHKDYCENLVRHMHFASKDIEEAEANKEILEIPNKEDPNRPIIFLDVEISPSYRQTCDIFEKSIKELNNTLRAIPKEKKNEKKRQKLIDAIDQQLDAYDEFKRVTPQDTPALFLVNWKHRDEEPYQFTDTGRVLPKDKVNPVNRIFNPTPEEVDKILNSFNYIGHNVKSYDNHMLYAASQGFTPEELFDLSTTIINGDKEEARKAKFPIANNASYADTLDFASAGNKKGLKAWEIFFGASHIEWDRPWTWAVPKDDWTRFAEYCDNDVISDEMLFDYLQSDFESRVILSKLSGLPINDSTNRHTTELLTHGINDPQSQYVYTDLSKMTWDDGTLVFPGYEFNNAGVDPARYIPGTKTVSMKSIYRGEDPGEGGHKVGYPGIYYKVDLFDVASMHPHSAIKLGIFGPIITARFENLVEARVNVKHIKAIGDDAYNAAIELMNKIKAGAGDVLVDALKGLEGKSLKKKCKSIANALKTAINSVYGLTAAKFNNKLRDPRNVDNIVAKYGALFMINLKHELWDRGATVVHVSTDSIKVADCTPEIEEFIMEFGKKYGYTFEHEAHYERIALVDNVNYVAWETMDDGVELEQPKWTVTGDKFANPYVFKTLFTHEAIEFDDMCETFKAITDGTLHLVFDEGENEVDRFIGRIGEFCAMSEHGATLYSVNNGMRSSPAGTKGFQWLESVEVKEKQLEDYIDHGYYQQAADDCVAAIEQFGSFDDFVSISR